jgi:uncharacterized protein YcaQ
MKISKEEARRFLVRYQHLDGHEPLHGTDGILEFIKKVGCIQYDPLNIIGRNADLVLQARISDYRQGSLDFLLYENRSLIDGWDKVMSIYSSEDWQYFSLVREHRGREAVSILEYRNSTDALLHTDTIMEAIAKNGPMQPKQIQLGSVNKNEVWGHRNLSGAAMDYLYHIGKLGVFKKINTQKVYDLIENVIPADILNQPTPFKTEQDFYKWYVYRRIGSMGMLWNRSGGGWLGSLMPDKKSRQYILDEYVDNGLIQIVEVEGVPDKFYIRSMDISSMADEPKTEKAVKFIAPLDNILWDRDMLAKLFDFEYTWEVYVPAAKRKFGYYVIPVLYGDRFIARFEPEKSTSHFKIKNWWWEKGVDVSDDLIEHVMQAMQRFSVCFEKAQGVHESVLRIISS